MEFKFNEIFRSSKNNKIRIPDNWVDKEHQSSEYEPVKNFKQIKGTILTDTYQERLAEFEAISKNITALSRPSAPEEIATLLSHQIPPALFRIPREGKSELEIRNEWQRLFE